MGWDTSSAHIDMSSIGNTKNTMSFASYDNKVPGVEHNHTVCQKLFYLYTLR